MDFYRRGVLINMHLFACADESKTKTLFVKNLAPGVTKRDLEEHFVGVESVTLPFDYDSGSHKG